jgi:hypothetical protein
MRRSLLFIAASLSIVGAIGAKFISEAMVCYSEYIKVWGCFKCERFVEVL